jgi:hypothetical protein
MLVRGMLPAPSSSDITNRRKSGATRCELHHRRSALIQVSTPHASALLTTIAPITRYFLVPPPDYVVIAVTGAVVILAAVLIAAVCVARVKRSASLQHCEALESSIRVALLLDNLQSSIAASDARIGTLAARLDEHARSLQGATSTSYNVAIRMARSGTSRQDLITACGVTQQEADLLLRLHGADRAVRSAA